MAGVLCVDDEPEVLVLLQRSLEQLGHHAVIATSLPEALDRLGRETFDVIVADYRLREGTGIDLIESIRARDVTTPVIILTGFASIDGAVASMRSGAADYITKPIRQQDLARAIRGAIERGPARHSEAGAPELPHPVEHRIEALHESEPPRRIVGDSRALRRVLDLLASVAPTRAPVLLEGESGTGKELFARALHEMSPRRDQPFITVNCAALPDGLVESVLFGHEKGAFTGADSRREGAFERAHLGTLMLDEVSEMRVDLQAKLLRALQEHMEQQEFERVGGSQPVRVDVRLVATTNRDLWTEVAAGRFRRDLYFRLNVMPIRTPPLRERLEDLPLLVAYFAERAAIGLNIPTPEVPPETLEFLRGFSWPGNVRELGNAVTRAVIMHRSAPLVPASFDQVMTPAPPASSATAAAPARTPAFGGEEILDLDQLKLRAVERALQLSGGNMTQAAALLGVTDRTLRNIRKRFRR